ncbi:MAG: hypothetical protein NTW21_36595 [Verrucomicrobia bacterium]|nr:hypothetical protein [Verrucomicrobiota bacterium]
MFVNKTVVRECCGKSHFQFQVTMNSNYQATLNTFLRQNGITDPTKVGEIASGFDLSRPVYTHLIHPGDRLFQFLRNEEMNRPFPQTGNWFCLPGANMDSLAIFGGGAGRRLQEFTVSRPVMALEGTAGPVRRNWGWAGGGRGGATQIFLPHSALLALVGIGTHLTQQSQ